MSKPHYLIKIKGNNAPPCLGEQLINILKEIQPFTKNLIWYACDIDSTRLSPIKNFQSFIPRKVGSGNINDMVNLCKNVEQFLSGVFLGLSIDRGNQLNNKYTSEDDEFRDLGEALLEIRAFDTTYYEIYTNNFIIIEALAPAFHATPEVNPKFNNLLPKNQPEIDW